MRELLEQAKEFMDNNPYINEIELTNAFGDKVKLVRNTPMIYSPYPDYYQYPPVTP